MDELDQIIDKAIADGLSDDDIQFLVGEWKAAHPTTADNIKSALRWGGNVVSGMLGMGSSGTQLVKDAEESPVLTAFGLGTSAAGATALKYGGPTIRKAAEGAINLLDKPAISGSIGAMEGYRRGGTEGAIYGAGTGIIGGSALSRLAKGLLGKFLPKPPIAPPPFDDTPRLGRETLDDGVRGAINSLAQEPSPYPLDIDTAATPGGVGGGPGTFQVPPFVDLDDVAGSVRRRMSTSGGILRPQSTSTPDPVEPLLRQLLERDMHSSVQVPQSFPSGHGSRTPPVTNDVRVIRKPGAALVRLRGIGEKKTPASTTPSDTLHDELRSRSRDIDWRTTDAVPIDAMQRSVDRPGGSILEAGESQIGLGEQAAAAAKIGDAGEVERLLRALRQRMHITSKAKK